MIDSLAELRRFVAADDALSAIARDIAARSNDDPAHDLEHCLRVALWTLRIGGAAVEVRSAIAAALLHDAVNLPKDSPERARASEASAEYARGVLREHGFPAAAVSEVCDAIRDHSFSRGATPESPLGKALQDADRLEALGALGLMRCLITGTKLNARPFDPNDPFAEHRPLDDERWSVDHLFTKLLRLPETLQTELGRSEAHRRVQLLHAWIDALGHELDRRPPQR